MGLMNMVLLVGCLLLVLKWVVKRVNSWLYESKLDHKIRYHLPPGDLGWPLIGNMCSFLTAFKSNNPDSFISNFVHRPLSLSLSLSLQQLIICILYACSFTTIPQYMVHSLIVLISTLVYVYGSIISIHLSFHFYNTVCLR